MSELLFGEHADFPSDDEPRYKQIAKEYRRRIIDGDLQDGEKLPSEAQLCDIHNVSAITARAAMKLLREWGFANGIRGKGVFVRRLDKLTRIAPQRYFRGQEVRTYVREAEASGAKLDVQHETIRTTAPADIAKRLGIAEGDPVTCTRYFIRMGNPAQPVTSSQAWEPLAITGGTDIELPHEGEHANKGIVDRFGAIGLHVNQVEEVLDIRTPTPEEARALEMPPTRPLVEIHQTFRVADRHGAEDLAVETADILFPADRYELRYVMEIH
ncbi:GntR family transcriptional regulator [Prauserella cavernicola]|uniref:GntR family transcriptional regulator n=1 Tax=Prauserella cavernicola TaxID=2800127 RepID=A0A934QRX6_9PSEU|nr:GntR family transcriptional regulator [Prauserella cavernicola]MBK1785235.1 GntR family transcriptional regulator [Prauserella cavernicola]